MRVPRQINLELGAPGAEPEALLPVVLTVDGWTLRASHWPRTKTATLTVTATTGDVAVTVLALATDGMTEPPHVAAAVSLG